MHENGGKAKSGRTRTNNTETVVDYLFHNVTGVDERLNIKVYTQYKLKPDANSTLKRHEWYDQGNQSSLVNGSRTIKRPPTPTHPFQFDTERIMVLSTDPGNNFGSKCEDQRAIEQACADDKDGKSLAQLLWKRHLALRYVICMIYAMCQSYFDGLPTDADIDSLCEGGLKIADQICKSMFGIALTKDQVDITKPPHSPCSSSDDLASSPLSLLFARRPCSSLCANLCELNVP